MYTFHVLLIILFIKNIYLSDDEGDKWILCKNNPSNKRLVKLLNGHGTSIDRWIPWWYPMPAQYHWISKYNNIGTFKNSLGLDSNQWPIQFHNAHNYVWLCIVIIIRAWIKFNIHMQIAKKKKIECLRKSIDRRWENLTKCRLQDKRK